MVIRWCGYDGRIKEIKKLSHTHYSIKEKANKTNDKEQYIIKCNWYWWDVGEINMGYDNYSASLHWDKGTYLWVGQEAGSTSHAIDS